jgi:putative oxidoreductase
METNVIDLRFAPLAVFLLRIALGAMFLAHSLVLKLFVYTLPGTAGFFASLRARRGDARLS